MCVLRMEQLSWTVYSKYSLKKMINHVSDLLLRGTVLDNSSLLEELRSCYMVYFINFTLSGSRGLESSPHRSRMCLLSLPICC